MRGLDEFLALFGGVTISQIVKVAFAILFMFLIYKQIKQYIQGKINEQNMRIAAEKQRDADIQEALVAVRKYPEYREQSIKIQELLEGEIQELRIMIQEDKARIANVEQQERVRERNRLRDTLLQHYRYYTDTGRNPSQSWNVMEAEAFWALFKDYEALGGNDYMHTTVQPAMQRLKVVSVDNK